MTNKPSQERMTMTTLQAIPMRERHDMPPPAAAAASTQAASGQLVAPELLARADRILFVTHLAIGDFAYLQGCLHAFARAYPHLRIHVWVDERRRSHDPDTWVQLRNYALYDWLATCPWIDKVYDRTYSPATLAESIDEARAQAYPVVMTLTVLDCHRYARLAR